MIGRSLAALCLLTFVAIACDREERDLHVDPAKANTEHQLRLSELQPGTTRPATAPTTQATTALAALAGTPPTQPSTAPATTPANPSNPSLAAREAAGTIPAPPMDYSENAYALAEGKRLYMFFNCVGCHANGGGGMGPPLMDDKWLYGYEPEHVFSTIVQGRPNGMPSFGGRIPDYQVWQLAAYVRSMSGYARPDAAPGRSDHMRNKPPEHSTTQQGQSREDAPAMTAPSRRWLFAALAMLSSTGCTGLQASMDPAGTQSREISGLWWLYCWVCVAVYVITMAVILVAFRRRRVIAPEEPETQPAPTHERQMTTIVAAAVGVTTIILFVLMIGDFVTGRAIASLAGDTNPLTIKLIARQWWWEARYDETKPSKMVITANELTIPVGRAVRFQLQSNDVIHSFWVPNLAAKKDMVPGHGTTLWTQAERTGRYYGNCAEFCGLQHAQMRIAVNVVSNEEFEAWRSASLQPAAAPSNDLQARGKEVFLGSTCIMCHTISGTHARGTVGPNLTHVSSRKTIAAVSLDNTPENLARWIQDPQAIKPGTRMPQHNLPPEDSKALVEYIGSLK